MAKDLAVFLSDDFSDSDVLVVRNAVISMANGRSWTLGPPEFVDDIDDTPLQSPEDEAIRTVGAVLTVSDRGETPQTPRAEVESFIHVMAQASRATGLRMEVQLGEVYCGTIVDGVPNSSITVGLIDAW